MIKAKSDVGDVRITVPRGTYAVDIHARIGDETVRVMIRSELAKRTIRARTNVGDITVEGQ